MPLLNFKYPDKKSLIFIFHENTKKNKAADKDWRSEND